MQVGDNLFGQQCMKFKILAVVHYALEESFYWFKQSILITRYMYILHFSSSRHMINKKARYKRLFHFWVCVYIYNTYFNRNSTFEKQANKHSVVNSRIYIPRIVLILQYIKRSIVLLVIILCPYTFETHLPRCL